MPNLQSDFAAFRSTTFYRKKEESFEERGSINQESPLPKLFESSVKFDFKDADSSALGNEEEREEDEEEEELRDDDSFSESCGLGDYGGATMRRAHRVESARRFESAGDFGSSLGSTGIGRVNVSRKSSAVTGGGASCRRRQRSSTLRRGSAVKITCSNNRGWKQEIFVDNFQEKQQQRRRRRRPGKLKVPLSTLRDLFSSYFRKVALNFL